MKKLLIKSPMRLAFELSMAWADALGMRNRVTGQVHRALQTHAGVQVAR